MKIKFKNRLSAVATMTFLIVGGWATACKTNEILRKNVENESELGQSARTESCGTILSFGEPDDSQVAGGFSLIAQAAVCGWIEGHDEPWQALGLTIVTSEVGIRSASVEGSELKMAAMQVSDNNVYAVTGADKVLVGHLVGAAEQDSLIQLLDEVKAELLVAGKPFKVGSLDNKADDQKKEVVLVIP